MINEVGSGFSFWSGFSRDLSCRDTYQLSTFGFTRVTLPSPRQFCLTRGWLLFPRTGSPGLPVFSSLGSLRRTRVCRLESRCRQLGPLDRYGVAFGSLLPCNSSAPPVLSLLLRLRSFAVAPTFLFERSLP